MRVRMGYSKLVVPIVVSGECVIVPSCSVGCECDECDYSN